MHEYLIIIASAFERVGSARSVVRGLGVLLTAEPCLSRRSTEQGSAPGKAEEIAVGEMEERDGGAPQPLAVENARVDHAW